MMESRIGAEAAVQLDTSRKNNAMLEAQVQYLVQANNALRADLVTSVTEARQVVIAHRNEVHKALGQATELARTCSLQQYRASEAAVLLGQRQSEIDTLRGQVSEMQELLRQATESYSEREVEKALVKLTTKAQRGDEVRNPSAFVAIA